MCHAPSRPLTGTQLTILASQAGIWATPASDASPGNVILMLIPDLTMTGV
jgi:hypothetical protein